LLLVLSLQIFELRSLPLLLLLPPSLELILLGSDGGLALQRLQLLPANLLRHLVYCCSSLDDGA